MHIYERTGTRCSAFEIPEAILSIWENLLLRFREHFSTWRLLWIEELSSLFGISRFAISNRPFRL
jgi:hypothetical protein